MAIEEMLRERGWSEELISTFSSVSKQVQAAAVESPVGSRDFRFKDIRGSQDLRVSDVSPGEVDYRVRCD